MNGMIMNLLTVVSRTVTQGGSETSSTFGLLYLLGGLIILYIFRKFVKNVLSKGLIKSVQMAVDTIFKNEKKTTSSTNENVVEQTKTVPTDQVEENYSTTKEEAEVEHYAHSNILQILAEVYSDATSGKIQERIKNRDIDFLTIGATLLGLIAVFFSVVRFESGDSYTAFEINSRFPKWLVILMVASLIFNLADKKKASFICTCFYGLFSIMLFFDVRTVLDMNTGLKTAFGMYFILVVCILQVAAYFISIRLNKKIVIDSNNINEKMSDMSNVASKTAKQLNDKSADVVENLKNYSKSKKGQKVLLSVISAVIVIFVGFNAFSYFTKTTIDLTENLEISLGDEDALNGQGTIYVYENPIDYDINDPELENFVNNITYEFSPGSSGLSNGDVVTVRALYSEATAEELNLKVVNDSKEITVDGLTEIYNGVSSIDSKTLEQVKQDAKKSVEWSVGMSSLNFEVTYVKSYFVTSSLNNMENSYIGVFKAKGVSHGQDASVPLETYPFEYYMASKLDSKVFNTHYFGTNTDEIYNVGFVNNQLYDTSSSQLNYLTDPNRIQEVIFAQLYSNDSTYTITPID